MVQLARAPVKAPAQPSRDGITLDGWQLAGQSGDMLIYKIFRAHEWAELAETGATRGAPVDLADGYIHFSTAATVAETAAKHFAGAEGLVLVACAADPMGEALRWEPSRGGALFPHLYREMRFDDVAWSAPLPLQDGLHQFPEGLE